MAQFTLTPFNPCPAGKSGIFDQGATNSSQLIALDIQSKYQFVDSAGSVHHEYMLPNTSDLQNCGGYVDKVIKYRNPALAKYLATAGVSRNSFDSDEFPILGTRSPKLDLMLYGFIEEARRSDPNRRIELFDHGCTVAEHYDLLDIMIKVSSDGKCGAAEVLSYTGMDRSALLLSIATMLHPNLDRNCLRLQQAEGSDIEYTDGAFDLSLTVGVVNHVAYPLRTLKRLLAVSRRACVLALWVTNEDEGFWAINHAGVQSYFFSRADLRDAIAERGDGAFYEVEYVPETETSQSGSYIGLGDQRLSTLGCYHMAFCAGAEPPFDARRIELK